MKSIAEINNQIKTDWKNERKRPKQIMDQDTFNRQFLNILNKAAFLFSKGRNKFIVNDDNEWLLKVVFAYLNRNEDDKNLTYAIKIDNSEIKETLDLDKGLTILGNFGIGKSLLMTCIYQYRAQLKLKGRFVTSKQIFDCKKPDLSQLVGMDKFDLFIDDLGDEPMKKVNYGQEDTPVASVLKTKLDSWERLPETPKLFVTSNCDPKKLKELYGGRIVSRLYGATNVIISKQKIDFRKI
jgi:DNA replication protein DnaC